MEENINPQNPVQQTSEQILQQPAKNKLPLKLIVIFVLLIILGSGAYYYLGVQKTSDKACPDIARICNDGSTAKLGPNCTHICPEDSASPTSTQKPITDETANWKTYTNKEAGFEFKYPPYLDKLIQNPNGALRNFWVQIEKRDGLNNPYKGQECSSTCGRFAEDSNLYQKQFDLLTQASNTKDCIFDKNYVDDFKNFILFYGEIPGKWSDIQGIKLDNRVCGIKYGASDGYDVSHDTYNYRLVYIVKDKAIGINFPIFPFHVFDQVDSFYTKLGFDSSGDSWSCTSTACKEGQFFNERISQNMNNNDTVKSVIQIYDQILSTFKFTN